MGNQASQAAAILAVACLALVATAPAGHANLALEGPFVVQGYWPYAPQLHCTVLFDHASEHRCSVEGPANMITHIRARIAGDATVHAAVDRILPDGARLPIGVLDCTASCSVPLHYGTEPYGRFTLDVTVRGAPRALVSVDVEQQTGLWLP